MLELHRLGIKGLLYRNIKAIYNSIHYQVMAKGGSLPPISSQFGLKQGGVLSPLLFNLFIDDMEYIFDEACNPVKVLSQPISHLLYADHLVLLSTTACGLSNCLSKLEGYCHTWQLEVNIKKSKIIIFNSSGRLLRGPKFSFQGKPMELVKSYCYLGVDLICNGSFHTARTNPLFSMIAQFKLPCAKTVKLLKLLNCLDLLLDPLHYIIRKI